MGIKFIIITLLSICLISCPAPESRNLIVTNWSNDIVELHNALYVFKINPRSELDFMRMSDDILKIKKKRNKDPSYLLIGNKKIFFEDQLVSISDYNKNKDFLDYSSRYIFNKYGGGYAPCLIIKKNGFVYFGYRSNRDIQMTKHIFPKQPPGFPIRWKD